VQVIHTQTLVTIDGRHVLVEPDPEGRAISGCPWVGPGGQKPCLTTSRVAVGYSPLLRIDGRRVCLDTVSGLTDAMPASTFKYSVRAAGQALVGQQT
jgi:hypothetical protein